MTSDTSNNIIVKDMMNRDVVLPSFPVRIVSLVPSLTELLSDLDLEDEVIGITKFCVHPASWRKEKVIIGGTKNPKLDKIQSLNPDLIIANKEENNESDIIELEKKFPVYVSDIQTIDDALRMIKDIGELTFRSVQANKIVNQIRNKSVSLNSEKRSCLYFIWKDPWMIAGKDTFITEMLGNAGYKNLCPHTRYPILDESLKRLTPDEILLSSEPYPFKEKHFSEIASMFPDSKIRIVDGEYFSWYGSRMLGAFDYFRTLNS
ncbi:ABC transporter substrate-binding protein [Flammeovirgaceae bacterium KN852]|uniref:ABC transporter substrate-binding protein n=2 Tax=Marinigracilibium pacificum TaxID=2729599 RepID=A0A848J238_9BACT|nr:ABC transporter substrate-binding protein [Marinigracilibium pacificum]